MATADLLLHPVRIRIVQAFLGGRALTTRALSVELTDIPVASLYRHVARLVDGGVLAVVAERRVRGALERSFTLRRPAVAGGLDQPAAMTADDHRQAFIAYIADLLGEFDHSIGQSDNGVLHDEMRYESARLWLDDTEYADLLRELARVLGPRLANSPRPDRKRRVLSCVMLPG